MSMVCRCDARDSIVLFSSQSTNGAIDRTIDSPQPPVDMFPDEEKARIVSEMAETSMTAVSKKHGIAMSALSKWKKKFPPKSFALLELNDTAPQDVNDSKPAKQIDPPPPPSNVIRVIVLKRIIVEFPLTAEPGAIALFIKALEN